MANVTKDLGPVSAYAVAVAHGYKGTEEEWAALQAESGTNAQRAENAANASEASARRADAQASDAENSAQAAQAAANSAAASDAEAARLAAEANASANQAMNSAADASSSASAAQASADAAARSVEEAEAVVQGAAADAKASAESSAIRAETAADRAEAAAQSQAQIDDAVASFERVWSSKATVDRLCPAFEESGAIVQCYPVEWYPLHAVSHIEPAQAGTGDPSPDNVRPISGWIGANVALGSKNLLVYTEKGLITPTGGGAIAVNANVYSAIVKVANTDYVYLTGDFTLVNSGIARCGLMQEMPAEGVIGVFKSVDQNQGKIDVRDYNYILFTFSTYQTAATEDDIKGSFMCSYEQNAVYEKPEGKIYTAQFPETVYGGTLDWNSGVLTVTHVEKIFDGSETWYLSGEGTKNERLMLTLPNAEPDQLIMCNVLKPCISSNNAESWDGTETVITIDSENRLRLYRLPVIVPEAANGLTACKAWLAEQYAAGTPVTIVYELAEPYTIQCAPQPIPAQYGLNSLWSDTGDTEVSGCADPKHVIKDMEERLAALEAAVSGIG